MTKRFKYQTFNACGKGEKMRSFLTGIHAGSEVKSSAKRRRVTIQQIH